MKVILKETMDKVGKAGDVIDVTDGYARNFLLPHHKAVEATKANLKLVETLRKTHENRMSKERNEAEAVAGRLSSLTLVIEAKAGEEGKLFGAVTSMQIAHLLKEKGFVIDKRRIELPEPIKSLGEHSVSVDLAHEIKGTLKIRIQALAK